MKKPVWLASVAVVAACSEPPYDEDYVDPVVRDDELTVAEDSTGFALLDLTTNDDGVRDLRETDIAEPPQHGTIRAAYSGGTAFRYVPDPGYHGPDRFTYVGRNYAGVVAQTPATVIVNVVSDGVPYEQSLQLDQAPGNDIAVGDLTGDGRLDALIAERNTSTVLALINTTSAAGMFEVEIARFEGGHTPRAVELADFDGDGFVDVVVASEADGLVVLRNRGSAALELEAPMYLPSGKAVDVAVIDLDRDGRLDLAAVDSTGNQLIVRLNASSPGSLAFGTASAFATPKGPIAVATGDADRSGGEDLIVISSDAGMLSLFVNAMAIGGQTPAFSSRIDRATGTNPSAVLLADLDGDQRTEIAVIEGYRLWIYANRSAGGGADQFNAARVLDLPYGSRRIAAIDLDATGPIDLVIGSTNNNEYSLLFNRSGTGGFSFDTARADIGDNVLSARARLGDTLGLAAANMDGTGRAEILTTGTSGTFVLFE